MMAAVSGLVSLINGSGWALFVVLMAPKTVCLGRRLRPCHLVGACPGISQVILVRSALVASLWSLAFAVALSPVWRFSTTLLAIDAIATLLIVARFRDAGTTEVVRGEPIQPLFPASVRSWFLGRCVAICGTDQDLKGVLSRCMTEAGAVVSEVSTDSGLRMREVRPLAVVIADQVDETSQEETAIATRHTANETLRIGAEMLLRVVIFPSDGVRHEVSLAHRVLEAFAGLTRTRILTLGFPASLAREAIARAVMLRMATAQPGLIAGSSVENSKSLWRTLDRLEHRRSAPHLSAIKGPRSPLEGSSQAPAR